MLDARLKLERLAIVYQSTLTMEDVENEMADDAMEAWHAVMKLLIFSKRLEVPGAQVTLGMHFFR